MTPNRLILTTKANKMLSNRDTLTSIATKPRRTLISSSKIKDEAKIRLGLTDAADEPLTTAEQIEAAMLNPYKNAILSVVYSIYENGGRTFTTRQVITALRANTSTVHNPILKKVNAAIMELSSTWITIDFTEHIQMNNATAAKRKQPLINHGGHVKRPYLYLKEISDPYSADRENKMYTLMDEKPPLYDYAQTVKQLSTVNNAYFNFIDCNELIAPELRINKHTENVTVLSDVLIRALADRSNSKLNNRINLDNLLTSINPNGLSPKLKRTYRGLIPKILEYWRVKGLIGDWQPYDINKYGIPKGYIINTINI